MRIEQLKHLMTISEMNNLTKAAKMLHISQPTLTASIKQLEKELNTVLLERHHNGVTLTKAGEYVVESSKKIFKELNYLENKIAGLHAQEILEEKSLSIDVTPFIGNTYFWSFWKECHKRLNWNIKTKQYDARKILERINSNKSSVGILLINRKILEYLEQQEKHMNLYLLRQGTIIVLLRENHPLAQFDIVPVEKLLEYPLLFPKNECIPILKYFEKHYYKPKKLIISDLYMLPYRFLNDNLGVVFISSVFLPYFGGTPFGLSNVVVKEIDKKISADLYLVMNSDYALTNNGILLKKEIDRYFCNN